MDCIFNSGEYNNNNNNNNNNNKLIFPPDQIQFQKGAKKDDIKGHYIIVPVH